MTLLHCSLNNIWTPIGCGKARGTLLRYNKYIYILLKHLFECVRSFIPRQAPAAERVYCAPVRRFIVMHVRPAWPLDGKEGKVELCCSGFGHQRSSPCGVRGGGIRLHLHQIYSTPALLFSISSIRSAVCTRSPLREICIFQGKNGGCRLTK